MKTISELKQAGYIVTVYHERRYKFAYVNGITGKINTYVSSHVCYDRDVTTSNMDGGIYCELLPNGGTTTVSVVDPSTGDEFEGVAHCRKNENYNRKLGVKVALDQVASLMLVCPGYKPRIEL